MNTAVLNSVLSGTMATLVPNFLGSSGIGMATWVITLLIDSRSEMMTGSKLSLNRSCRYPGNFGGRFEMVVNVESSPAAATQN